MASNRQYPGQKPGMRLVAWLATPTGDACGVVESNDKDEYYQYRYLVADADPKICKTISAVMKSIRAAGGIPDLRYVDCAIPERMG